MKNDDKMVLILWMMTFAGLLASWLMLGWWALGLMMVIWTFLTFAAVALWVFTS